MLIQRSLSLLMNLYLSISDLKAKTNSNLTFSEFRWLLQCYGLVAAFYNSIGHQKRCEAAYVTYVQLVEQYYEADSIEASNAYYLVGVYYFEQSLINKAFACF
jgi:hypothetical protein